MKYKSEEETIELEEVKQEEETCACPMCAVFESMDTQVNVLYTMLDSLSKNLEAVKKLHEKHDSK